MLYYIIISSTANKKMFSSHTYFLVGVCFAEFYRNLKCLLRQCTTKTRMLLARNNNYCSVLKVLMSSVAFLK